MPKRLIGAAAIIQDAEGRVLLVRHSYGKKNWEIPGGLSEQDESSENTAIREVQEETGLVVTAGRLTGVYYDPEYDMHHFAFICSSADQELPKASSDEILEVQFCDADHLPRPISDFTVQRIKHALQANHEQLFHVIGPRQWLE
ncbi:NUDIX hydrolase [Paenibacillus pinihumi]|uniref:NUDIX hydrolase n=1 Tax=Paenibacillus pinihumi TaxID=669462 RepID=UPI00040F8770|nr:NUDIX hydrolase [Paenibacillus pinihumi]